MPQIPDLISALNAAIRASYDAGKPVTLRLIAIMPDKYQRDANGNVMKDANGRDIRLDPSVVPPLPFLSIGPGDADASAIARFSWEQLVTIGQVTECFDQRDEALAALARAEAELAVIRAKEPANA